MGILLRFHNLKKKIMKYISDSVPNPESHVTLDIYLHIHPGTLQGLFRSQLMV